MKTEYENLQKLVSWSNHLNGLDFFNRQTPDRVFVSYEYKRDGLLQLCFNVFTTGFRIIIIILFFLNTFVSNKCTKKNSTTAKRRLTRAR